MLWIMFAGGPLVDADGNHVPFPKPQGWYPWVPYPFQVEMLPEGADPLDARYNVIQWVHRSTRGWSYGSAFAAIAPAPLLIALPSKGRLMEAAETLFGRALSADHKTIFALLSWATFGLLLAGRGGRLERVRPVPLRHVHPIHLVVEVVEVGPDEEEEQEHRPRRIGVLRERVGGREHLFALRSRRCQLEGLA